MSLINYSMLPRKYSISWFDLKRTTIFSFSMRLKIVAFRPFAFFG